MIDLPADASSLLTFLCTWLFSFLSTCYSLLPPTFLPNYQLFFLLTHVSCYLLTFPPTYSCFCPPFLASSYPLFPSYFLFFFLITHFSFFLLTSLIFPRVILPTPFSASLLIKQHIPLFLSCRHLTLVSSPPPLSPRSILFQKVQRMKALLISFISEVRFQTSSCSPKLNVTPMAKVRGHTDDYQVRLRQTNRCSTGVTCTTIPPGHATGSSYREEVIVKGRLVTQ